jgi:TPR repeat protein
MNGRHYSGEPGGDKASNFMVHMTRGALLPMIVLLGLAPLNAGAGAEPPADNDKVSHVPVPFYPSHVVETKKVAAGMVVIETTDPAAQVIDWYRANLKDQIADLNTDAAHHHFLTHNGSGVGVSSGSASTPQGSKIELLWDAAKYGDYKPSPQGPPPEAQAPSPPTKTEQQASIAPPPMEQPEAAMTPPPKTEQASVAPPPKEQPQAALTPAPKEQPQAAVTPPPKAEQQASILPPPKATVTPPAKTEQQANLTPPLKAAPREPEATDSAGSKAARAKSAGVAAGLNEFRAGQYAEALAHWQAAVLSGDATAALYLGMMYDTGQGVTQSSREALNWYRTASDEGNPIGSFNIGVMYDAGLGVDHSPVEAARWYAQAAEMGHGRAAYVLGLIYETGAGVPQDLAQANHYFRIAAELGIAAARDHLDSSDKVHLRKAPEVDVSVQSFQVAQNAAPAEGSRGAEAAAQRFSRAADNGDPSAAYNLAYCYEKGIGVSPDLQQAYALYREAAEGTSDPYVKSAAEASAAKIKTQLGSGRQTRVLNGGDVVRP